MVKHPRAFMQILIAVGISFLLFLISFTLSGSIFISLVISGMSFAIYLGMEILMYREGSPPAEEIDGDIQQKAIQKRRNAFAKILRILIFLWAGMIGITTLLFVLYKNQIWLLLSVIGILCLLCSVVNHLYLSRRERESITIKIG